MKVLTVYVITALVILLCMLSCSDNDNKNPVSSSRRTKVYNNFDIIGKFTVGSGQWHSIFLPLTTTQVIKVQIRKDSESEWEEYNDWIWHGNPQYPLTVFDYNLILNGWEYWIIVRVWEIA